MINTADKNKLRQKRHMRVRNHIHGTAERPRLNVFNDSNYLYVQLIDDEKGVTLTAGKAPLKVFKTATDIIYGAKYFGAAIAKNALDNGITEVVLDMADTFFKGYCSILLLALRKAGLKF